MLVSYLVISFIWLMFLFLATINARISLKFSSTFFFCFWVRTPQLPCDLLLQIVTGKRRKTLMRNESKKISKIRELFHLKHRFLCSAMHSEVAWWNHPLKYLRWNIHCALPLNNYFLLSYQLVFQAVSFFFSFRKYPDLFTSRINSHISM